MSVGDKNEMNRKLNSLAKAALRFKGCSNRLVDAANSIIKHAAGSKGHQKAVVKYEETDKKYVEAENKLDELIDAYGDFSTDHESSRGI